MTKISLLSFFLLTLSLLSQSSNAQQLTYKQGELILCFHPKADRESTIKKYAIVDNRISSLQLGKCLSDQMNIWSASFDHTKIDDKLLMKAMLADPEIAVVQRNHFLKSRNRLPNDAMLEDQWQWINMGERGIADSDVDADDAWSLSTGGLTRLGDTIVIAVIDVGVDYMHEDLADNIWINHKEIPGNRIDDDENGYVDDVRGWNVLLENDNIEPELFAGGIPETHGTEILGTIGAVGNNHIGVTGINWNVKIMNVFFNTDLNEADMIAAYGYILAQRQLYNETNGEKGAFVVSTNLSYGDEDLTPADAPIWCAVYDSLGKQGILNCTATANSSIDIDSIQDVPTSCASDYMIAVTATDRSDQRSFAAYGKHDIDLAAPGSQLLTTSIPDYEFVTGTSYATPIVAGAIGLLYASPCADLAALARTDPSGAALQARSLILDHVDKIAALEDEIATGGRLNVFRSLEQTLATCQTCIAPFDIIAIANVPDSLTISFMVDSSSQSTSLRWRILGDTTWTLVDSIASGVVIPDLASCTTYQYQIESSCSDGTSTSSDILSFTSEGCCRVPEGISAAATSTSEATVALLGGNLSNSYELIYGANTDTIHWDTIVIMQDTLFNLSGLSPCTTYLLFALTICDGNVEMASTDTIEVRTLGCGTCLDSVYCTPNVFAVGDEWIERVVLNTLDVTSGFNQGYGDYTGNATPLKQGNTYEISITPGFADDTLAEYYFGWIDYNQNALFDIGTEEIFSSDTASSSSVFKTTITIPKDAPLGLTRMRLLMLFDPVDDVVSGCETEIDLGEAEDFCVEIIVDSLLCSKPENLDTMDFQGTSTMIVWERVDSAIAYVIRHRKVGEEEWMEAVDTAIVFPLSELEECSMYEVQVQAVCQRDTSGYTESLVFSTFCSTSAEDLALNLDIKIFPNPFGSNINLKISSISELPVKIDLYQLDGRSVFTNQTTIHQGDQIIELINLDYLPPGLYILGMQTNEGRVLRKVLKS